jgi:hypothetical protein
MMKTCTPKTTQSNTPDPDHSDDTPAPMTPEERRREALEMIREDWERIDDDDGDDDDGDQIHGGGGR